MLDRNEVLQIVKLAKLYADENNLDELTKEINEMIDFADGIHDVFQEYDESKGFNELNNVFREDEIQPSDDKELILKNINGGECGFFMAPDNI